MGTYDVFLSYSHSDMAIARAIAERLKARGLGIFLDDSMLIAGSALNEALEGALRHARAVVVLLSREAASSQWVNQETAYALRRQQTVIPVLLDRDALDSPLGSLLGDRVFIDCTDHDPWQAAERVAEALGARQPHMVHRMLKLRLNVALLAAVLVVSMATVAFQFKQQRPLAERLRAGSAPKKARHVDLARANLAGVNVESFDFTEAVLAGAQLTRARCSAATFDRAVMSEVQMDGATARGASFVSASLIAADLRRADLTGADLRDADLRLADLRGAILTDARLEGARLEGAIFDAATRWPAAFDPRKQGARTADGVT